MMKSETCVWHLCHTTFRMWAGVLHLRRENLTRWVESHVAACHVSDVGGCGRCKHSHCCTQSPCVENLHLGSQESDVGGCAWGCSGIVPLLGMVRVGGYVVRSP